MDCPFTVPAGGKVEHWRDELGWDQFIFDFPNGWGASVIRREHSYGSEVGLWELAVLGKDGNLNYSHPVAQGDVRGWLSEAAVSELLAEIAATVDPSRN